MKESKKSIRRTGIKIGIALMAVALIVSGCGGSKGGSKKGELASIEDRYTPSADTPAWQLDKKEELTELTWYVNADWWNTEFGKDVVTKKIQEDLNVKIKFITGDDTKLNTFFAGGEMPDLITTFV